jgi:hypothetical protein
MSNQSESVWVILADRLEEIRKAREQLALLDEKPPVLVFDNNDMATLA